MKGGKEVEKDLSLLAVLALGEGGIKTANTQTGDCGKLYRGAGKCGMELERKES